MTLHKWVVHIVSLETVTFLVRWLIVTVNVVTTESFGGYVVYRDMTQVGYRLGADWEEADCTEQLFTPLYYLSVGSEFLSCSHLQEEADG